MNLITINPTKDEAPKSAAVLLLESVLQKVKDGDIMPKELAIVCLDRKGGKRVIDIRNTDHDRLRIGALLSAAAHRLLDKSLYED